MLNFDNLLSDSVVLIVAFVLFIVSSYLFMFIYSEIYVFDHKIKYLYLATAPLWVSLIFFPIKALNFIEYSLYIYIALLIFIIFKYFKITKRYFQKIYAEKFYIIIFVFYFLYYSRDVRNNITIGGEDTLASLNHKIEVYQKIDYGYNPGPALLFSPIQNILTDNINAGLFASLIGVFLLISIVLALRSISQSTPLFFLGILPLPFFKELNLNLIGNTSTAYGVYIIILTIILIIKLGNEHRIKSQELLIIFAVSSSVGIYSPPLLIYLVPVLLILFVQSILFKMSEKKKIYKYLLVGSFFGFVLYQLNSIITQIYQSNANINLYNTVHSPLFTVAPVDDEGQSHVIWLILKDLLDFENLIRPLEEFINIFGWISLLLFFIIAILSLQKKSEYFPAAFFASYLGLVTMTGIFELSFFKGRAGLYYMAITILVISLLAYKYTSRLKIEIIKIRNISGLAIILLAFNFPLEFYRYHDEDFYFNLRTALSNFNSTNTIYFYSELPQIKNIDIRLLEISKNHLFDQAKHKDMIAVLDFNPNVPDLKFSRSYSYLELKTDENIERTANAINLKKIESAAILERKLIKSDFKIFFQDDNYKVYLKS